MLEINEIQKRLKLVNVMAFSKLAGVHPNSLYRVRDGSSKETVSYATIKKISDALEKIGGSGEID
jgi:predicted transcriptional regulator